MLPRPVSVLLDGPFGCTPGDRATISLTERPVGSWSTSCLVRVVADCTVCEMFSSVPVTRISSVTAAAGHLGVERVRLRGADPQDLLDRLQALRLERHRVLAGGSDGNR